MYESPLSFTNTTSGKPDVRKPSKLFRTAPTLTILFAWRDGLTQGGPRGDATVHTAAFTDDGSVILAGSTASVWGEDNIGPGDFAASKLDADGTLVWTWQVNCRFIFSHLEAKAGTGGGESIGGLGTPWSLPVRAVTPILVDDECALPCRPRP